MQDAYSLLGLLLWLQCKHFVFDYLLQPAWILHGKGDLRHPGGYAHAAFHSLATLPAVILLDLSAPWVVVLTIGEFALHFTIDHLKALHGRKHPVQITARAYWAAHGFDQLMHHVTYTGILMIVTWFR